MEDGGQLLIFLFSLRTKKETGSKISSTNYTHVHIFSVILLRPQILSCVLLDTAVLSGAYNENSI